MIIRNCVRLYFRAVKLYGGESVPKYVCKRNTPPIISSACARKYVDRYFTVLCCVRKRKSGKMVRQQGTMGDLRPKWWWTFSEKVDTTYFYVRIRIRTSIHLCCEWYQAAPYYLEWSQNEVGSIFHLFRYDFDRLSVFIRMNFTALNNRRSFITRENFHAFIWLFYGFNVFKICIFILSSIISNTRRIQLKNSYRKRAKKIFVAIFREKLKKS